MDWAWRTYGEEEWGLYRFLFGKPEGKGPLVRPRLRWEGNIKMDFREGGLRIGTDTGRL
jgi:hypothetical protein